MVGYVLLALRIVKKKLQMEGTRDQNTGCWYKISTTFWCIGMWPRSSQRGQLFLVVRGNGEGATFRSGDINDPKYIQWIFCTKFQLKMVLKKKKEAVTLDPYNSWWYKMIVHCFTFLCRKGGSWRNGLLKFARSTRH